MANLNSSTKILFKRSKTSGKKPEVADIQPGELFVNLADKSIHTSDGTDIIELGSKLTDNYLPLDGGVLTGPVTAPKVLVSAAQATEANSLTRKDYVDKSIDALNKSTTELANTKVNKAGDTMTGTLTMNANIDAWNREVHAGTIILGETGNRLARTHIAQWADPASKNHRFEVYASGNNAERTRKNIISADITNVNETSASLRVIVAGDLKTDGALQTDGSLQFNPASNSKSYFTARTWGDNGNRSQILEFADKDGWQFYIQRQESNKQTSASFAGHLTSTASMTVGSSLTVGANATINGGQINLGSSRGAIVINGLPNGTGGFVNQHDADNLGGLYNEIDDSAPSVYSPLIKQRYKQGGITWSQGTLYNAGSWTVHLKVGTGNNAGDKIWTFGKDGSFTSPGNINAGGTITAGPGYGLKVDSIAKRDGTAFIAADGNINIPAGGSNGFNAGWLLGQINTRLNNAQNTANNAQTAATNANNNANGKLTQAAADGRYKRKNAGWTVVWAGTLGGGATATLSQDIRFRTVWLRIGGGENRYMDVKFGPDGNYYFPGWGRGWVKYQLSNGGKTLKNIQDDATIATQIVVENE